MKNALLNDGDIQKVVKLVWAKMDGDPITSLTPREPVRDAMGASHASNKK